MSKHGAEIGDKVWVFWPNGEKLESGASELPAVRHPSGFESWQALYSYLRSYYVVSDKDDACGLVEEAFNHWPNALRNDALTQRAYLLVARWLEWARMHGHLEHAEGIVKDSREMICSQQSLVIRAGESRYASLTGTRSGPQETVRVRDGGEGTCGNPSVVNVRLLVALQEIAEYRPTPQARCGGCVNHVIDIAHRAITANASGEGREV